MGCANMIVHPLRLISLQLQYRVKINPDQRSDFIMHEIHSRFDSITNLKVNLMDFTVN